MRKVLKKLIICILIILIIFNFMMSNIGPVYADPPTTEELNSSTEAGILTLAAGVADGYAGLYTWFARAGAVILSTLFQIGTYFVLISGGVASSFTNAIYLTPYDIFFNNFALTNINIFQTNDVKADSFVANMRTNMAACFMVFEVIALILLAIKFFLGVAKQFFLNTTAGEKKIGADLAADSAISFLLVILMSSIVLVIILINEAILEAIGNLGTDIGFADLITAVRETALSLSFILGMASTIAIALLTFFTMKFALAYILRFITISVLIIIAPLMPVFFSMSKARSGAPSALNRWLRIFVSNVFIQSIHALIYTIVIIYPFAAISTTFKGIGDLMEGFLLIAGLIFIKQIEKFIINLFGMDEDVASLNMINRGIHNVVNTASKVAIAGATVASVASGGGAAVGAVSGQLGFGKNLDNNISEENNNVKIHEPSSLRNMLGNTSAGTMGIIGSVATLDYATDHPDGASFEEDDMIRRNRDRAREEREAYEEKMRRKNQGELGENQEQIEENNQQLLPMGQLEDENNAEDIAEQALEEVVISTHQENDLDEREIFDEDEFYETDENIKIELELTPKQAQERKDIQGIYNELLEDIRDAKELQIGLADAIKEAGSDIGDEKSSEIKMTMDDIFQNKGFDAAKDYALSLGDGEEGEFAKVYLVYLDETNSLNEEINKEGGILELVDKGIDDGVITIDEGDKLLDNAINFIDGKDNVSDKIFGKIKPKTNDMNTETSDTETATTEDQTQVVEKESVVETQENVINPQRELTAVADIPTSIINEALKTSFVKGVIKRSSENISAVQGEITTGGSITGESLARIINNMETGTYSEENYKKIRGAAISAGESDNMERYHKNPTPANAAACGRTEAGRNYITHVEERAIGASVMVTSELINTSNRSTNTDVPDPTNKITDTINSLESKKASV